MYQILVLPTVAIANGFKYSVTTQTHQMNGWVQSMLKVLATNVSVVIVLLLCGYCSHVLDLNSLQSVCPNRDLW